MASSTTFWPDDREQVREARALEVGPHASRSAARPAPAPSRAAAPPPRAAARARARASARRRTRSSAPATPPRHAAGRPHPVDLERRMGAAPRLERVVLARAERPARATTPRPRRRPPATRRRAGLAAARRPADPGTRSRATATSSRPLSRTRAEACAPCSRTGSSDGRAPLPALAGHRAERAGVERGEAGVGERGAAERGADGERARPPAAGRRPPRAPPRRAVAAGESGPSASPAASAKRTTCRGCARATASVRGRRRARAAPSHAHLLPQRGEPLLADARAPAPSSSTEPKPPCCSRYSRIARGHAGPMPSSSSSCSAVAVLRSSGTPSAGSPRRRAPRRAAADEHLAAVLELGGEVERGEVGAAAARRPRGGPRRPPARRAGSR